MCGVRHPMFDVRRACRVCGTSNIKHRTSHITSPVRDDVARSLTWSRNVARREARNFYWGMRRTPEPKRAALYAIYAWMRAADALADEADSTDPAAALARVDRFERTTLRALEGADARGPLWPGFRHAFATHHLDPAPLRGVLDGQRRDLRGGTFPDLAALHTYCEQVASTVGLLCVDLWGTTVGADPAEVRRLATERGIALQLTNILRDLREDADAGRCYLPMDRVQAAGLELDHRGQPILRPGEAFDRLMDEMLTAARSAYRDAAGLETLLHPDGRASSRGIAGVYAALLERIAANPRQVLARRVRVPTLKKLRVLVA